MKRLILPLFVAIDLALLAWVVSLWFTPQGKPIGTRWQAPAPIKPDIGSGPTLPKTQINLGHFVATLERPLFVPSRRPPAAPPPVAAPVVEPLPPMRLMAVYGNADGGGLLAVIDGRLKRLRLGDTINGWTVKALQRSGVELGRGDETTVIALRRTTGAEPPLDAAPAGSAATPAAQAADAMRVRELEERRRAAIRRNERRARSGLPPLPLP